MASPPPETPTADPLSAALSPLPAGVRREERAAVPYLVGSLWTARQRQAHSLHEISYRACFKPQLPDFFISRLTKPGDCVYDPFMGRGTTLLQAALLGRRAIGNDGNPLALLLLRPRLQPPSLAAIEARLKGLDLSAGRVSRPDLLAFYHPETLAEIEALRRYLLGREGAGTLDPVDDWIRMVALSRLTGHSSGFFSAYSLPPNQAVSVAAQQKINARLRQAPARRPIKERILKKSARLLRSGPPPAAAATLLCGDARLAALPGASVDLVVTSPPFLDVVHYAADNWLRLWFAGLAADDAAITLCRRKDDWAAFTAEVLRELARIVKPGGHIAYEVGEVRRGTVELDRLVIKAARGLPLALEAVLMNEQQFTKTARCWGVGNNDKGTNSNRIVLLRRR